MFCLLSALGMPCAFDPGCADFAGMTDERLWVSQVKHGCYVEVDEKGTKAAAATTMGLGGGGPEPFWVDRPFLYVIREKATGTILLMGRVLDPRG